MSLIKSTKAIIRGVGWTLLCLIPLLHFIRSVHPCLPSKAETVPKKSSFGVEHHTLLSKPLRAVWAVCCLNKANSPEYFLIFPLIDNDVQHKKSPCWRSSVFVTCNPICPPPAASQSHSIAATSCKTGKMLVKLLSRDIASKPNPACRLWKVVPWDQWWVNRFL